MSGFIERNNAVYWVTDLYVVSISPDLAVLFYLCHFATQSLCFVELCAL